MGALHKGQHHITRWLLSFPGLDTNLTNRTGFTALHYACLHHHIPLDIVILLAELSSRETVSRRTRSGHTALDFAVKYNHTSSALYLSWLGAERKEKNREKYSELSLQTWVEAGCQQHAQFWAVAANDVDTLKILGRMEKVTLDRPKLRSLAKLLNRRKMWSFVTSLESLAWERVRQSSPVLASLAPATLLQQGVPNHVVGVIAVMNICDMNWNKCLLSC